MIFSYAPEFSPQAVEGSSLQALCMAKYTVPLTMNLLPFFFYQVQSLKALKKILDEQTVTKTVSTMGTEQV